MFILLFHVLGGLSGFVFLYVIGFRKFNGGDLLLGLVVFFISIFIQSPIQQLPIIQLMFSEGLLGDLGNIGNITEFQVKIQELLLTKGMFFIALLSIWLGFVAGIVQTSFKYLFTRNKSYTASVNIGAGFGLTEAFYIGVTGLILQLTISQVVTISIPYYAISSLERFSASLFHVGSTLYIFDSLKKGKGLTGFLLIVAVHGLIDSLAAFYQFTGSTIILILVESIALLMGLLFTLKLYRKALLEPREETLW